MRSRRRQRKFELQKVTVSDDSYGQPIRSYSKERTLAGFFETGSSNKGEMAEAIQGTQTNTLETRYIPGFEFTLEKRLKDIESKVVYRVTGVEDINGLHRTIRIDLEELIS